MNIYYYTENLRLKDDILEYKTKNNFKKIHNNNWHHILNEYGWEKLYKPLIILLNKYRENKKKIQDMV